jgi:hypothetical protein
MSKFATLALIGACANANWSDLGSLASHLIHEEENLMMPAATEAKYLAVLLGMDENRIYPEASNSLDEMAAAMLERNVDYTTEHSKEIPTFHVAHSGSDRETNSVPLRNG